MSKNRRIKLDQNYSPIPTYKGDEIYANGIFNFSISRILEHIASWKLKVEEEKINVKDWFKLHLHNQLMKNTYR